MPKSVLDMVLAFEESRVARRMVPGVRMLLIFLRNSAGKLMLFAMLLAGSPVTFPPLRERTDQEVGPEPPSSFMNTPSGGLAPGAIPIGL